MMATTSAVTMDDQTFLKNTYESISSEPFSALLKRYRNYHGLDRI